MNKLYNDTAVQAIANAIRAKNGSSDTYTIAEMSTALNDLSYYAKPTIENVPLATFEADGLPLNSLKVSVEAKQEGSGVPSPENVRPISGWSEVNVSDVGSNILNTIGTDTNNGYVNGYSLYEGGTLSGNYQGFITEYSIVKPNQAYIISGISGVNTCICIYDEAKQFIESIKYNSRSSFTFETPLNARYVRASVPNSTANICQVNFGTEIKTYEPYNPDSYTTTIPLGQTVYGAEVDVVNGGGTDRFGAVDMSTLTFTNASRGRWLSTGLMSSIKKPTSTTIAIRGISEQYAITDAQNLYDDQTIIGLAVDADGNLLVRNGSTTDTPQGILVYELATPTTLTTSPTPIKSLEGTNNLSVDCGEVIELEYFKEV